MERFMVDNNKNENSQAPTPVNPNDEATVLSSTHLSRHDSEKVQDTDSTLASLQDDDATIISPTAVEKHQSSTGNAPDSPTDDPSLIDDEATLILNGDEATVLAGGTEALHAAINTHFSPNIRVGSVIKERFTLEKLLGRGGMGEVY